MEKYYLKKTVKVSDPEIWYGETEIEVEMFHDDFDEDDSVRVIFSSTDDFMMYRDFNEWDLAQNWKWCKCWFWDKIPEVVDYNWLCEHGYAPF